MKVDMTKPDSRYTPFVQQKYCCVAACLQMVMYRHGVPLIAQEDLAYELGLTVPEENVHLYARVRTGEKPKAGWGTQIQAPKYEVNKALRKLNIPLRVAIKTDIKSEYELRDILDSIQKSDGDALVCFDYGVLWNLDKRGGHVCVFDWLENKDIWLVDPEYNVPKYRKTNLSQMYKAINFHGTKNICGIWVITKH